MSRASRVGILAASTVVAAACTTTTTIEPQQLTRLSNIDEALVVRGVNGHSVRLDPNSAIRFRLANGALTSWYALSDFRATDRGLFLPYKSKLKDGLQIEGYDLDPSDIERLRTVVSDKSALTVTPEKVVISAPGRRISRWLQTAAPQTGSWTILTDVGVFGPRVNAGRLHELAHGATYEISIGVRFENLAEAEVKNLSGPKSLALVAGSAAVVALVVASVATGGGVGGGGKGGGTKSSGSVNPGRISYNPAPIEVGLVALDAVQAIDALASIHYDTAPTTMVRQRRVQLREKSATLGFDSPAEGQAESLFDGVDRRRAKFALVPSYEAGPTSFGRGAEFVHTLGFDFRIKEFTELGIAVSQGVRKDSKDKLHSDATFLGHVGLHLPLDAHHRFAAAVGSRLGVGNRDAVRLDMRYGVRLRVFDQLSLGVYPVNARWRKLKSDGNPSKWDFPSSVELSWAF